VSLSGHPLKREVAARCRVYVKLGIVARTELPDALGLVAESAD